MSGPKALSADDKIIIECFDCGLTAAIKPCPENYDEGVETADVNEVYAKGWGWEILEGQDAYYCPKCVDAASSRFRRDRVDEALDEAERERLCEETGGDDPATYHNGVGWID